MLHVIASFVVTVVLVPSAAAGGTSTTFLVEVPGDTPPDATVYIAGDFQGWNPGSAAHALAEQGDGRWMIELDLPVGTPIQFKFTRGSWATVEKGRNGEEIPNRTHTPSGGDVVELEVARWADGSASTITGNVESFTHAPFLGGRRCWVYLPPDYATSTDHYPVLYMHDGQNLFDDATSFAGEWQVDETCEALIGAGEIEPIIVIGIENGPNRCFEYTPWFDPSISCGNGGGGGDAYLQAIRDHLLPEVNSRYRTRTGPAHTYMAGSSLGGLISTYAGYAHDDAFGRIGSFSPSYWWADGEMMTFAGPMPRPRHLDRFYQDMGTAEGGITNLRAMRDIAIAQGFVEGVDLLSIEADGHAHNETFWALRFPDAARFLIDPPQRPCPADLNFDAAVNFADVLLLLTTWGPCPGCDGDLTDNGTVDFNDLLIVLTSWGPCPS